MSFDRAQDNNATSAAHTDTYGNGDTLLHLFARQGDPESLSELIDQRGVAEIAVLAKTHNNKGYLPIDELYAAEISHQQKTELYELLIALCQWQDLKNINEPIDINNTLAQFSITPGTTLYQNMLHACFAANAVRKDIQVSTTHPTANGYSFPAKKWAEYAITNVRNAIDYFIRQYNGYSSTQAYFKLSFKDMLYEASVAKMTGVGNCYEYSVLAMKYLCQNNVNQCVKVYSVAKGDHIIAAIGSAADEVICDAWAGKVFPAKTGTKHLGNYRYIILENEDYLTVATKFNPSYHFLKTLVTIESPLEMLNQDRPEEPCWHCYSESIDSLPLPENLPFHSSTAAVNAMLTANLAKRHSVNNLDEMQASSTGKNEVVYTNNNQEPPTRFQEIELSDDDSIAEEMASLQVNDKHESSSLTIDEIFKEGYFHVNSRYFKSS